MSKSVILVTNDDGIVAPGIRALIEVASQYGDVVVVAPDNPQSGKGHAITMTEPLRFRKVNLFENVDAFECSGTPVDCVKLAKNVILRDRDIRLCVSGINHGANNSINILYSGTMSAAMEASLEDIESIGFSLLDYGFDADFSAAKHFANKIIKDVLEKGMVNCKLLNVNIPKGNIEDINGIRICRQSRGTWIEEFQEGRDPRGQRYFWMTGAFQSDDMDENADYVALRNKFVSVVPCGFDLTKYEALEDMKFLNEG